MLEEPLSLCALAKRADVAWNLLSSVLRSKTNSEEVLASIRKLPKPGVIECRIKEIDWQMTKLYWDKSPLHPNVVNVADTGFLRLICWNRPTAAVISNRAFITSKEWTPACPKASSELLPFPVFRVRIAVCVDSVFE